MTAGFTVDGYWAEAKVRSPEAGGEWYLSGAWLDTPEEAVAWLRGEADRLAAVLESADADPAEEDCGYACPVSVVFREWAADAEFRAVQCAALAEGQPVSANARGMDRIWGAESVEVLYSLSARPLLRPPPNR
ncbi:hypothetical protein [Streptomyces bohaiensis]|uniref:DUF4288 domain-containing protein n=1 Tax=Streptomyces bohaiensis TaxID=1431344 RepID=A0ABX1CEV1_9ACTN|nr:hypothetical protein [Streptomyces bohaiensis]NJQ15744.1 hypothetical protein [Streptomyces bohaiensis]